MSVIDRVPLADQIAEVKREIEMRRRTYIRMIDQAKMTTAEAERRTTNMCAVLHTLEAVGSGDVTNSNDDGEDHDARTTGVGSRQGN